MCILYTLAPVSRVCTSLCNKTV